MDEGMRWGGKGRVLRNLNDDADTTQPRVRVYGGHTKVASGE